MALESVSAAETLIQRFASTFFIHQQNSRNFMTVVPLTLHVDPLSGSSVLSPAFVWYIPLAYTTVRKNKLITLFRYT